MLQLGPIRFPVGFPHPRPYHLTDRSLARSVKPWHLTYKKPLFIPLLAPPHSPKPVQRLLLCLPLAAASTIIVILLCRYLVPASL